MILKNNKRIDGCSDTVPIGTLNPFLGSTAPYGYLLCQGQKVSKITYKELYEICGNTFGQSTDTEFYLPDLRGQTIAGYKEGDSTFGTLGGLIGSLTHLHNFSHTHGVPGVAHTHSTGNHTLTVSEMPSHGHQIGQRRSDETAFVGYYAGTGGQSCYVAQWRGVTDDVDNYKLMAVNTGGSGAHNHGNTGSTTPSSTTTNSQSTTNTSSTSNIQPTMVLNWIVKAFQLMPNQSYVENSLESDSTINSLSAAKGKELNEKILGSKSNIQVGDNLKGQTIYFYFPPDMEEITEDYSPIIESYDSDTGTTELLLYQAITSEIRIRYIYSDGTIQTVTKDLVMGDWSGSFMMGGIVRSIDTSCPLYNYFYLKNIGLEDRVKTLEEGENYSTNEQRIGTWVDGKPLYRKMVDFGSLPSNGVIDKAHNIANVEHMHVNLGGTLWCLNSQSYTGQGQIFSPVFSEFISSIYVSNIYMSVKTVSPDANAFKMLMCLEYTKTTD